MRKSLLLLVFALFVALGALWFLRERPERGLPQEARVDPAATSSQTRSRTPEGGEAELAEIEPNTEKERVELPSSERVDAEPSGLPRCRIFGEVTDVEGSPLAGILVKAYAVGCRWVSVEDHPEELPNFETETNAAGRFELDTPLPTCSWISLTVDPSDFHVQVGRDFGRAGGRNEEPLREGDNDLGTFVLAEAGAFEGIVRDESGEPIEGCRVSLDGAFPGGYVVGSSTNSAGEYTVGGAPAGQYVVKATMRGFLTERRSHLDVIDGEVVPEIDFVLRAAPKISGRVVDEEGEPLAGVRLWGWPTASGQGAGDRTKEDGTFTIFLPQRDPYTLEASLKGYEDYDSGQAFPPGTADIEIVLEKPERMVFSVVDGKSGRPIDRFGLFCFTPGEGGIVSRGRFSTPEVVEREGGEALLPGVPEEQVYVLYAPGYAPKRGRVEYDRAGEARQTIRVERGGTIRGRLRMNDRALASPTLRLEEERVPLRPDVTTGKDDIFSDDWGPDVEAWLLDRTLPPGQKDGSFEIDDLSAGTYRLTLTASGSAPRTVGNIRVELGEETDLGDITAIAPSEIRGTIVLGQGLAPAGLIIAPGSRSFGDDDKERTTDATGSFAFTSLAAGTHYLWIEEKMGVLTKGPPIEVELGPGEIKTLQIDLTDRIPATLEVHVSVAGRAVEGLQAFVVEDALRGRRQALGTTDREGKLVGYPGASESAILEVRNALRLFVGRSSEPFELARGVRTRLDLEFDPGRLRLRIPAPGEPGAEPASPNRAGFIYLVLTRLESKSRGQTVLLQASAFEEEGATRTVDLGWIEPGNYELSLQEGEERLTAQVEVVAGEAAIAVLD